MEFNIAPYELVQTGVKLFVNIIGIGETDVTVYYELRNAEGRAIESGNKTFPKSVLAIIAADPIPEPAMNQLLAAFGLELAPPPEPIP